jgi:hypothetical protein
MRNHPLFQKFDPEDSCIVALHRADERWRRRLRSEPERKDEQEQSGELEGQRYVADDSDLPAIFFERGSR